VERLQTNNAYERGHPIPHSEQIDRPADLAGFADALAVRAAAATAARTLNEVVAFGKGLPPSPCGDWIDGVQADNCGEAVLLGVLVEYLQQVLPILFEARGDRLFWQFWVVYVRRLNRMGGAVPLAELEEHARLRGVPFEPGDLELLGALWLVGVMRPADTPLGDGFVPLLNCIQCAVARIHHAQTRLGV
jgi:hypothetical protein